MSMTDVQILQAALQGLEKERERIEVQIRDLRDRLRAQGVSATTRPASARLSPEAKSRISAAQKKRWARYRKEKKEAKEGTS